MVGFILGILFTLLTIGVGLVSYHIGRKGIKTSFIDEMLTKEQERKQELQMKQLDDFSNMMNYDVDIAYNRKEV